MARRCSGGGKRLWRGRFLIIGALHVIEGEEGALILVIASEAKQSPAVDLALGGTLEIAASPSAPRNDEIRARGS